FSVRRSVAALPAKPTPFQSRGGTSVADTQRPPLQIGASSGHSPVPSQRPQWLGSLSRLMHMPLQQVSGNPHRLPHALQFILSIFSFLHSDTQPDSPSPVSSQMPPAEPTQTPSVWSQSPQQHTPRQHVPALAQV